MGVKFSIITVSYNAETTIEKTIRSVLCQDADNFEYIVIDGLSNDNTVNIIKKYSDKITYWVSEHDAGIYDAMNKGIKKATGEYVAFINANDWYETDALRTVEQQLELEKSPILYGLVKKYDNGLECGYIGLEKQEDREILHFKNRYCHQGLFIKRELFSVIGEYDTTYKVLADFDWILKAHDKGFNPYIIEKTIANFTLGGISSSSQSFTERCEIVAKHYYKHKPFSNKLELLRGIAEFHILMNKDKEVLESFFTSEKYIIWGCGNYGEKCYDLIKSAGKDVVGFVDKTKAHELNHGLQIWNPEELFKNNNSNNDIVIFVATPKYEVEIVKELKEKGVKELKYQEFSKLLIWAYKKYHEL